MNNTILITGGGTGIGRGLAEAFHALGNQVIIAGRSPGPLHETTVANPGMASLFLDVTDPVSIADFASQLAADFPKLHVLINNAGIMRTENLVGADLDPDDAEAMIATNLLGPIRLTDALLPLLQKQHHATVITVSSGLAFLPLAMTPTYCATKAAIHSYTQSLRYQLRNTAVEVLELIPPHVRTTLMGERQSRDPGAMPLDEYIAEVMEIIKASPASGEICVERVHPLRHAACKGDAAYQNQFLAFNNALSAARES